MVKLYYNRAHHGRLYLGNCLEVVGKLPPNSISTMITDPPAGIAFMNKEWDKDKGGRGKWIEWLTEIMKECYKVLKPGAYGFVWALPRTSHWTATACENAGFQIKDIVVHIFGTGFPKSCNISKQIDKKSGVERKVVGKSRNHISEKTNKDVSTLIGYGNNKDITASATIEAELWEGYGTALKPAHENWIMIAKPNEGTYAENALKHGVAGLNIDGGRIEAKDGVPKFTKRGEKAKNCYIGNMNGSNRTGEIDKSTSRWPANVIHDGSDEVVGLFPQTKSGALLKHHKQNETKNVCMSGKNYKRSPRRDFLASEGSASRYFYCSKPSKAERNAGCEAMEFRRHADRSKTDGPGGANPRNSTNTLKQNFHPTVKSLKVIEYLCTLTKMPIGGIVLDPFAGSGTVGVACERLNLKYVLIEKEEAYCEIAKHRLQTFANFGRKTHADR